MKEDPWGRKANPEVWENQDRRGYLEMLDPQEMEASPVQEAHRVQPDHRVKGDRRERRVHLANQVFQA